MLHPVRLPEAHGHSPPGVAAGREHGKVDHAVLHRLPVGIQAEGVVVARAVNLEKDLQILSVAAGGDLDGKGIEVLPQGGPVGSNLLKGLRVQPPAEGLSI